MLTSLAIKDELINTVSNYNLSLKPIVYNPGIPWSDHSSFWNENYGAVLLIELYVGGDRNPYNHSDKDRIDLFNMLYFKEITKLTIGTLATLSKLSSSYVGTLSTMKIYPNPVSGNFINLSFNLSLEKGLIEIYDMTVRIRLSLEFIHNEAYKIDISSLKSGIFILKLKSEEKIILTKLIKL